MRVLFILILISLSGCGWFGRETAKAFGTYESCVDGVKYIQFTSGVTVKYNVDGSIATCQ